MTRSFSGGRRRVRSALFADLLAGVTVAVVLVPQALAYAQVAGMPLENGLYAAALPLLAAALLASSPYLQVGPAMVTSLLTYGALVGLASPGTSAYVALGGLLAIVIGIARVLVSLMGAGVVAYLLSPPILVGFIPAAGILGLASQLPALFGAQTPTGGLLASAGWTLTHPGAWELGALAMGLVTLALMAAALRSGRRVLGPIVAVIVTTLISVAVDYRGTVVGTFSGDLPPITFDLPWREVPTVVVSGLVIALVGFAEPASIARTLAVADRRRWNPNREFASQGVANLVAGFSGGFPVGASLSRTVLNRFAGARTRISGAITGLAVITFIPLAFTIEKLPTATLAAIVIAAVATLLRLRPFTELWRKSRIQFLLAIGTFGLTLLLTPRVDLALLASVIAAISIHLYLELRVEHETTFIGDVLRIRPAGVLWFGSAQAFEESMTRLLYQHPNIRRLVIALDGIGRIDVTAAESLRRVLVDGQAAGIEITIESVPYHDDGLVSQIASDLGIAYPIPVAHPGSGPARDASADVVD